jgi:hypothetical protein
MHSMNGWVIPDFLCWVLYFSITENMHVDLCKDYGLTNILEFSPRFRDNILWPVVVGRAQETDSEPIALRKDHVDHDVINDHNH